MFKISSGMEEQQRPQQQQRIFNEEMIEEIDHTSSSHATQRKKKPFKKAPDAPKRFKSAYICFVTDKMENVKETLPPDVKVTEVMKVLAFMWKNLPPLEKLEYEKIARADKSRYLDELQHYDGPMQIPNKRQKKPADAPRRGMSAFLSYSQEMRPKLREKYPQLKNKDLSSLLAQQWYAANDEDKRPHIEKEMQQREKYYEDMAKWKAEEEDRKKVQGVATGLPRAPACKTQLDFLEIGTAIRLNSAEFLSNMENKLGFYELNDTESSTIDPMNLYLSDVEKDSNLGDDSVNEIWDHDFEMDISKDYLDQHIFSTINRTCKSNKKPMRQGETNPKNENSSSNDFSTSQILNSTSTITATNGSIKRSRPSPCEATKETTFSSINNSSLTVVDEQMGNRTVLEQKSQQISMNLHSSQFTDDPKPLPSAACYYSFPFNAFHGDTQLTAAANATITTSVDGTKRGFVPAAMPSYAFGFYLTKLQHQLQTEQRIHHQKQQQQQAWHMKEMQLQKQKLDQQQRILHELHAQTQILQQNNNSTSISKDHKESNRSKNMSRMSADQKSGAYSSSTPSVNDSRSGKTTSESGSSRSGDNSRSGSIKNLSNADLDNVDLPIYTYNLDKFQESEFHGSQLRNLMEETHSSLGRTKAVISSHSIPHVDDATNRYQTIHSLSGNIESNDFFQKNMPKERNADYVRSLEDQTSQIFSMRLQPSEQFCKSQQIHKAFPLPPLYEQAQNNFLFPQLHTTSIDQRQLLQRNQSSTGAGSIIGSINSMLSKDTPARSKNDGLEPIQNPFYASEELLNTLTSIPTLSPPLEPLCHVETSLSMPLPGTNDPNSAIFSLPWSIFKDNNQGNHQVLSNASSILKLASMAGLEDVSEFSGPRSILSSSKPRVSIALEYNQSHYLSDGSSSCAHQDESASEMEMDERENHEFV